MKTTRFLTSATLTFFPALIAYFLVVRALFDDNESDIRYAIGLLGIFAMCWLGSQIWRPQQPSYTPWQRNWRIATLVLPALLIYPMSVVVFIFGEVDMAAFVFHLMFGMGGTPWADLVPFLITALVIWTVFCVAIWRGRAWLDHNNFSWAGVAVSVLAINPLIYDLLEARLSSKFAGYESFVKSFKEPQIVDSPEHPNLLILYLEGLERSYLDHPELAATMPELAALEAANTSAQQIEQVFGTGWSLAGNLATQCGVPVLPYGAQSLANFSEIKEIMPNIVCLGDVLAERGYDQTYISTSKIVGNKMGYYGFDNYYSTHKFSSILDRDTVVADRGTKSMRTADPSGWGISDGEMFDYMVDYIAEKEASERPYSILMATMGTHGPTAVVSGQCAGTDQYIVTDDMRDALACTSTLVDRFLKEIAAHVDMENTRIVIMSDHLAHRNHLTPILNSGPRSNLFLLLDETNNLRLQTPGSMIDVYPTILDWLGLLPADAPYAGLGVSLLSDKPTLVERYGVEEVDARLRVDVELAGFIWR